MILHALVALYERLQAEGRIGPVGFQPKEILWVVELSEDGHFSALIPTGDGKKRGAEYLVPAEIKKSVNIAANLLWENPEYVFGVARAKADPKQAAKVPARHAAFLARLRDLPPDAQADEGLHAVRTFLEAGDFSALQADPRWPDLAAGGANVSFKLRGDRGLVCERPALAPAIAAAALDPAEEGAALPWCLVSGERTAPARLHPNIKGVFGGQSSGTSLVAFNLDAFESHGWEKGDNAPVGQKAAMAYALALNWLLERRERPVTHHREGETTFVFWPEKDHAAIEALFCETLGEVVADPAADGRAMKRTLDAVRQGFRPLVDDKTAFYVLALAPNAARLAVRSWHPTTVGAVARRMQEHFDALAITGLEEHSFPPLWRLLGTLAPKGDIKRLSTTLRSRLADEVLAAILDGTPYPATLLARAVERCRVESSVTPLRAALIKAVLSRRPSPSDPQVRELTVSLDPENINPGYRLGRLFAVLEGIQYAAQGKLAATIRDRYYGAAMTSPRAVFVQLDRLKVAHLKKLRRDKGGLGHFLEREYDDIAAGLRAADGLPAALSLDDQGRFILGYHHQRHHYLTRKAAAPQDLDEIYAALPEHDED